MGKEDTDYVDYFAIALVTYHSNLNSSRWEIHRDGTTSKVLTSDHCLLISVHFPVLSIPANEPEDLSFTCALHSFAHRRERLEFLIAEIDMGVATLELLR